MALSTPTFTNLDVGLPGGSLNPASARSLVKVRAQGPQVVRVRFTFPGFRGQLAHNLGERARVVLWHLTIRAVDETVLNQIDSNIEDALRAGEGTLTTSSGRSFSGVTLEAHEPGNELDVIRGGELDGWIRRGVDVLRFVVNAP